MQEMNKLLNDIIFALRDAHPVVLMIVFLIMAMLVAIVASM